VFGLTHIPRLEDWPVMPVERIGFMLMVSAFEPFSISVIGSEPMETFVASSHKYDSLAFHSF
jgi:hypothetical protein